MSKARLVITALFVEHQTPPRSPPATACTASWVYRLKARYEAEGEAAFQPRSRRPQNLADRDTRRRPSSWSCGCARNSPRPASTPAPTPSRWHLTHHHQRHRVPGHHPPDPDPRRRRHPRTEEATQVLLHPLRSRAAERDLAVRLHPLPAHRPRRPPRPRRGDHHLARRLHSRYALHVTAHRPGHRPDRAHHLPRNRWPARHPGLHADRQRDGLHRPLRRRPRRPQRTRATNYAAWTSPRRTPDPTTPPPAAKSNASNRP